MESKLSVSTSSDTDLANGPVSKKRGSKIFIADWSDERIIVAASLSTVYRTDFTFWVLFISQKSRLGKFYSYYSRDTDGLSAGNILLIHPQFL